MKVFVKKLNYSFDEENHIWLKPNQQGIAHNRQNKIEERLARIIEEASDLSLFFVGTQKLTKGLDGNLSFECRTFQCDATFSKIFFPIKMF